MNRRNFVVGLGTVATVSGVASVTAAQFADNISATTNFQVVPTDQQLIVERTANYDDTQPYWQSGPITDFANVTANVSSNVTAYVNTSENGNLGSQLALNNSNTTAYNQYNAPGAGTPGDGFFQIVNAGETDENVGITLNFGADADGSPITEAQVANAFQFTDSNGNVISSDPDGGGSVGQPDSFVTIPSGETEVIGLSINIGDTLFANINEESGNAFEETQGSIDLIDSVTVGIEQGT